MFTRHDHGRKVVIVTFTWVISEMNAFSSHLAAAKTEEEVGTVVQKTEQTAAKPTARKVM